MAMSFWRGIITGGLIGGMIGKLMGQPMKKMNTEEMSHKFDKMRSQAGKMMNEAREEARSMVHKKMKD